MGGCSGLSCCSYCFRSYPAQHSAARRRELIVSGVLLKVRTFHRCESFQKAIPFDTRCAWSTIGISLAKVAQKNTENESG